jgi:hypothetical protein
MPYRKRSSFGQAGRHRLFCRLRPSSRTPSLAARHRSPRRCTTPSASTLRSRWSPQTNHSPGHCRRTSYGPNPVRGTARSSSNLASVHCTAHARDPLPPPSHPTHCHSLLPLPLPYPANGVEERPFALPRGPPCPAHRQQHSSLMPTYCVARRCSRAASAAVLWSRPCADVPNERTCQRDNIAEDFACEQGSSARANEFFTGMTRCSYLDMGQQAPPSAQHPWPHGHQGSAT